jgi:hypothetical protein
MTPTFRSIKTNPAGGLEVGTTTSPERGAESPVVALAAERIAGARTRPSNPTIPALDD